MLENLKQRFPIACPRDYCGAGVGEPCRSAAGNLTYVHTPRMKAANEADTPILDLTYDEQVEYLAQLKPKPRFGSQMTLDVFPQRQLFPEG